MSRQTSSRRLHSTWRLIRSRPFRFAALAVAALPLFQTTGCYPDPIGALNFQLQLLVNTTFITAFNTFVQNLLHL